MKHNDFAGHLSSRACIWMGQPLFEKTMLADSVTMAVTKQLKVDPIEDKWNPIGPTEKRLVVRSVHVSTVQIKEQNASRGVSPSVAQLAILSQLQELELHKSGTGQGNWQAPTSQKVWGCLVFEQVLNYTERKIKNLDKRIWVCHRA